MSRAPSHQGASQEGAHLRWLLAQGWQSRESARDAGSISQTAPALLEEFHDERWGSACQCRSFRLEECGDIKRMGDKLHRAHVTNGIHGPDPESTCQERLGKPGIQA